MPHRGHLKNVSITDKCRYSMRFSNTKLVEDFYFYTKDFQYSYLITYEINIEDLPLDACTSSLYNCLRGCLCECLSECLRGCLRECLRVSFSSKILDCILFLT